MAVTLAQVKDYLRIDSDYENALLESFMAAADSYLAASVDGYTDKIKNADFEAKADIIKLALTSEMYRNRDPSNDQRNTFPYYITSQIAQLQYWAEETPAESTEGNEQGDNISENISPPTSDPAASDGDDSAEVTP